jgi:hypothetical protein
VIHPTKKMLKDKADFHGMEFRGIWCLGALVAEK